MRASTRCATGSRATCAGAPATTTSSRPSVRARPACAEVSDDDARHRRIGQAQGGSSVLARQGQLRRRHGAAQPDLRGVRPLGRGAREAQEGRHRGRAQGPGRGRRVHRGRHRRRRPRPAAVRLAEAFKPTKAPVHDESPNNVCYDWHIGDLAATDAAFAKAAHVVELDLTNNRLPPNAIEPRAAIGDYDIAGDHHTLYTTSQNPHVIRLLMAAFTLHVPEHKLRVVAPDVGGGFGSKIFHYAEELMVTWASRKLARP